MPSLPSQGQAGPWGTQLNDFLGVAHNSTGALKDVGIVFNVKDDAAFAGIGTDITAALSNRLTAAAAISSADKPIVTIPYGDFRISGTVTIPASVALVGDGPFRTELYWDGSEGGTMFVRTSINTPIEQLQLRSGTTKPGIYLDLAGGTDYHGHVRNVYCGTISESAGIAHIRVNGIVNAHFRDLRFGGGNGYAIQILTGASNQRSFHLEDFTVESSVSNTFKGVLNVVFADNTSQIGIHMNDARIESDLAYAANAALVVLESNPANNLNVIPATILLESIGIQVPTNTLNSIIRQTTTQTSVQSDVTLVEVSPSGVVNVLGGSWNTTNFVLPQMPGGTIRFMSLGRNSGSTFNRVHVNQFAIGGIGTTVINSHLSVSATLDFPSIAAAGSQELTIAVPGAVVGDACYASPSTTLEGGLVWNSWVSAADTVRIRVSNITAGAIDPVSRSWRVDVWHHF